MIDSYELVRTINRIKILTDRLEDKAKGMGNTIEVEFGLVENKKHEDDVTTDKWFDLEIRHENDTLFWHSYDNLGELENAVSNMLIGIKLCVKDEV